MTMKTFPVIVCVVVFFFSIFGQSIVLKDALGDGHAIQIINESGGTSYFGYESGGGAGRNYQIGTDDIWTLPCGSGPRIRVFDVVYSLRCGNTYMLYWNEYDRRLDVARVRD